MDKSLPKDAEKLLSELFTLIGESLIDKQIENRSKFLKAQNKIGKLLNNYNVENFSYYEKLKSA